MTADNSELDYLRTFFKSIYCTNEFTGETIASVNTTTKAITLTAQAGTLNQYAGMKLWVESGDNTDTEYHIISNTNATPTVLTVAETIPADLATDVVGVWSGGTVKHFSEAKKMWQLRGDNKLLIFPGNLVTTFENIYKKRYSIKLSQTSEIISIAGLVNILAGIIKLNKRQTITAYIKPSTLVNIRLLSSSRSFEHPQTKRWEVVLQILVTWSAS